MVDCKLNIFLNNLFFSVSSIIIYQKNRNVDILYLAVKRVQYMPELSQKNETDLGMGSDASYKDAYEAFLKRFAEEYSYCVYILTSPEDKVYIGYCKGNPIKRWQNGKGYRKNKDLNTAINHFGWDRFQKRIYRRELCLEEARELERILILTYDSWMPENGYNRVKPKEYPDPMHFSVYQLITPDDGKMYVGYTGSSLELEESAKRFEAFLIQANHTTDPAKGYNKSESGDREHGWKRTEESMVNTRAANRGIQRSPDQKEMYKRCKADISYPVWCEETQTLYLSVREAARQLGIPKTTLMRYLHAGKTECRGFHFRLIHKTPEQG